MREKRGARLPLGLVTVSVLSVGAFVWVQLSPRAALEALEAHRSGLYLEPWRVASSGLVHRAAPHLIFNLVTLWLIGQRLASRHGTAWFLAVFLSALVAGQVAHTLVGPSYVYGMSGGICGLYGFLLEREWSGDLRALARRWFVFWAYPLALLGQLIADQLGLIPIANVNHAVGIGVGWLIARGFLGSSRSRLWRAAAVLPVSLALLLTAYRPWDPVWRAVHGMYDPSEILAAIPCETPIALPSPDVASAPARTVTLLSSRRVPLALDYLGPEGVFVEALQTAHDKRSFRPLLGSVWKVSERGGGCVQQFVASRSGVVIVE